MSFGNVVSLSELQPILLGLRRDSHKVVFTNGCFDLLHVGHVRYLAQARALGDLLVVGLNSDASVKQLKGPTRPIQNQADRAEILSALRAVDYVIIFDDLRATRLISEIRPDIYVKGGDYQLKEIIEAPAVLEYGGEVKVLDIVPGRSTSAILAKSAD